MAATLNPAHGAQAGIIAAILDIHRYQVHSVLRDTLLTNDGLKFNDFGSDLGDPGRATERYYGIDVPISYYGGIRALKRELANNQPAYQAALAAYIEHRKDKTQSDIEKALGP